jgi:hypothetical protein
MGYMFINVYTWMLKKNYLERGSFWHAGQHHAQVLILHVFAGAFLGLLYKVGLMECMTICIRRLAGQDAWSSHSCSNFHETYVHSVWRVTRQNARRVSRVISKVVFLVLRGNKQHSLCMSRLCVWWLSCVGSAAMIWSHACGGWWHHFHAKIPGHVQNSRGRHKMNGAFETGNCMRYLSINTPRLMLWACILGPWINHRMAWH